MTDNYDEELIVRGPPLYRPVSDQSVGIQLYESLAKNGDKDLFIQAETNEKVTFRDYFKSTCRLAQALKNTGFRQNDIVAICSENNLVFYEPVIASMYLGLIVTPINPSYTENEILHVLNLTLPKAVFCSYAVVEKFKSVQKKCTFLEKIIVIDSEHENLNVFKNSNTDENFDENTFTPISVNVEEQIALILYSSGTTGLPKGVMITHSNINWRICHIRDPNLHIIDGRAKIGILPFIHTYGQITVMCTIIHGEMVVVLSKFNEELFYSTIEKYRISEVYVAPPILIRMSKSPIAEKYDFSSVRYFICGAAPLSKSLEDAVIKKFNISIRQGYGLTETTIAVLAIPLETRRSGSVGKTLPGISCKIRDPETGRILGPNQVGELCCKGGVIAKGYVNNPKATAETFVDGWLLTGDLAYYDEEGYFFIVDRIKELIKYKGFQVAPAELEALLINHPKIKDVGVIGVPDDLAGELPMAFVTKQDGVHLTEGEVKQYVKENISHTKWLRGGAFFIDAIPRNPSGKILRRELRDMLKNFQNIKNSQFR